MPPLAPVWFDGGPVLVTGGRGFLGSNLALRLAAARPDGEVVCVDNGHRDCFATLGVPAPPNLRFVIGDVRDPASWFGLAGRPSVVVHCAALAGVSTYYERPVDVLSVNGLGTAALLETLLPSPPKLFINLSTSEVYGQDAEGVVESGPTPVGPVQDPRWTYAASKVFGEHLVLAHHKMKALRAVSVRPFNVYGPGQVGEGAVRNFCEAALRGDPLKVTGDGSQTRAWIYVDDFSDAILALAASPASWGRSFNVGNPQTLVTTAELAGRIARLAGRGSEVLFEPHQGADVRTRWPRVDALMQATGWAPRIGLDEGLRRTLDFWRQQA